MPVSVRLCVCHELYDYALRINGLTKKCHYLAYLKNVFLPIFIQIVNVLTFIFKVKDFSRVHGQVGLFVIMSQMVAARTDTLPLPTIKKAHTAFPLPYLHVTLANSNGHGRGHARFDGEILANSYT